MSAASEHLGIPHRAVQAVFVPLRFVMQAASMWVGVGRLRLAGDEAMDMHHCRDQSRAKAQHGTVNMWRPTLSSLACVVARDASAFRSIGLFIDFASLLLIPRRIVGPGPFLAGIVCCSFFVVGFSTILYRIMPFPRRHWDQALSWPGLLNILLCRSPHIDIIPSLVVVVPSRDWGPSPFLGKDDSFDLVSLSYSCVPAQDCGTRPSLGRDDAIDLALHYFYCGPTQEGRAGPIPGRDSRSLM